MAKVTDYKCPIHSALTAINLPDELEKPGNAVALCCSYHVDCKMLIVCFSLRGAYGLSEQRG
jgi:hypothetical protein